jgi:hypothetical protein
MTQFDPDDRTTPEEALNLDYFRSNNILGGKNKMSSTFLRSTLRNTLQNSKNNEGFYSKNRKVVVGGLDLEELVAIDPDLSKKANDDSNDMG